MDCGKRIGWIKAGKLDGLMQEDWIDYGKTIGWIRVGGLDGLGYEDWMD